MDSTAIFFYNVFHPSSFVYPREFSHIQFAKSDSIRVSFLVYIKKKKKKKKKKTKHFY